MNKRRVGFIFKSLLASMVVSTILILSASAYTPNDPYWSKQWGTKKIDAIKAWDYGRGSTTITVAILDTGIDYNHADLTGRVIKGWNFYNNSNVVMDDYSKSHGTRVAGITGASINNSKGIAGIAQTKLLAVKVCDFMQNCPWTAIRDGIYYAANNNSKIIIMSIGKDAYDLDAERAVEYAYRNKRSLLISVSGNGRYGIGDNVIQYPGNFGQVIAVGATDRDDSRAVFSNYGSKLELVAPGNDTFSTIRNNGYEGGAVYGSGTSFAAPHVAGVAALVMSRYPTFSNDEVRSILTGTAVDLGDPGRDIYYGYGRVNASAAVRSNFLSNWRYNRRLTITGTTAGAQTNYPMKLNVYNSVGTDSPGKIYLNGNAKSDFSDLRFTKSDKVTFLDYWIESYAPGVSAVVWVEVGSIPASPSMTDIYIYYGNSVATGLSSGERTFLLFDDFLGMTLNSSKWIVPVNNVYAINNGKLQVLRQDALVSSSIYSVQQNLGTLTAAVAKAQIPWGGTTGSYNFDYFGYSSNGQWGSNTVVIAGNGNGGYASSLLNYVSGWVKATISGDSNEHIWEIRRTSTESYAFKDNVQVAGPLSIQYPTGSGGINFQNQMSSGNDGYYVDWVYVRKYVSPEPIWA